MILKVTKNSKLVVASKIEAFANTEEDVLRITYVSTAVNGDKTYHPSKFPQDVCLEILYGTEVLYRSKDENKKDTK